MQQLWRSNAFSAQCRSCDSHPSSQYHWRYRWRWYSSYHPVPYMARIVETSGGGKYQSVAFILFGNTSANFDASRNQSHHMSKPRDSHQLGNQTQKRVSKTVCMGSSYTPRCGISVMDFDVIGYPLDNRQKSVYGLKYRQSMHTSPYSLFAVGGWPLNIGSLFSHSDIPTRKRFLPTITRVFHSIDAEGQKSHG